MFSSASIYPNNDGRLVSLSYKTENELNQYKSVISQKIPSIISLR